MTALCPGCGAEVDIAPDGSLHPHAGATFWRRRCPFSGWLPADVQRYAETGTVPAGLAPPPLVFHP